MCKLACLVAILDDGFEVKAAFAQNAAVRSHVFAAADTSLAQPSAGADLRQTVASWDEVANGETLLDWLNGPFLSALLVPSAAERRGRRTAAVGGAGDVLPMGTNLLLGSPRLRQLRVAGGATRSLPGGLPRVPYLPEFNAGSAAVAGSWNTSVFGAWHARGLGALAGTASGSDVASYGSGGHVLLVPRDAAAAAALLVGLRGNATHGAWLDAATRAVALEFSMWCANTDLVTAVLALVEFSATGRVLTSVSVVSVPRKLFHFEWADLGALRIMLQALFCAATCFFLVLFAREARFVGVRDYLRSFWNLLELLSLATTLACCVIHVVLVSREYDRVQAAAAGRAADAFWPLHPALGRLVENGRLAAFSVLLGFLVLFKFLQLHPKLQVLWETFAHGMQFLGSFFVVLLVIMLGFNICGQVVFGPYVADGAFHSYSATFITLFKMCLGEFEGVYASMEEAAPLLAGVYFTLFIFIVVFSSLNVVIAIITKGYEMSRQSLEAEKRFAAGQSTITHNMYQRAAAVLARCTQRWATKIDETVSATPSSARATWAASASASASAVRRASHTGDPYDPYDPSSRRTAAEQFKSIMRKTKVKVSRRTAPVAPQPLPVVSAAGALGGAVEQAAAGMFGLVKKLPSLAPALLRTVGTAGQGALRLGQRRTPTSELLHPRIAIREAFRQVPPAAMNLLLRLVKAAHRGELGDRELNYPLRLQELSVLLDCAAAAQTMIDCFHVIERQDRNKFRVPSGRGGQGDAAADERRAAAEDSAKTRQQLALVLEDNAKTRQQLTLALAKLEALTAAYATTDNR